MARHLLNDCSVVVAHIRTDDPVTALPHTEPSLASFTSLADVRIDNLGLDPKHEDRELAIIRSLLHMWKPEVPSRSLRLTISGKPDTSTQDEFLARMKKINEVVYENCSSTCSCYAPCPRSNIIDTMNCREAIHRHQNQHFRSSREHGS